jgi:hypothetical protein
MFKVRKTLGGEFCASSTNAEENLMPPIVARTSVRPPVAAILPNLPRGQISKTLWGSFEQLIK